MADAASIRWQGNTPVSTTFDDPYYSSFDPCGEVKHTFIDGINLPELSKRNHLVIAETGFGSGLNFLLSVENWLKHASDNASLTYISVEAYPLTTADLKKAHSAFAQLPDLYKSLQQQWPGAIAGVHRLTFHQGRIRLLILVGDVLNMLGDQSFTANAWFLDGFAPARNPDMWSDEVFKEVARLSAPAARISSFTAAGQVRRGLELAGFEVERRPGYGNKRHCIRGQYQSDPVIDEPQKPWLRLPEPTYAQTQPSVAVIGAGVAGRTLARRLRQFHYDVTLVAGPESRLSSGSLLPRALIAPRLVRGSDAYAQFWAQSYVDAIRELDSLDDGTLWQGKRGLLFRFRDPQQKSLQALKVSTAWPDEWMLFQPAEPFDDNADALYFPKSGAIDPRQLFRLLGETIDINVDIKTIRKERDKWNLLDEHNRSVLQSDLLVIASGTGSAALLDRPGGLRNGNGQLISLIPPQPVSQAVLHDGYLTAADATGRVIAGATMDRVNPPGRPQVSEEATTEILSRLSAYLGTVDRNAENSQLIAWAGGRCDSTDHLPLAGPVQDDIAFDRDYENLFHGVRTATLPDPCWKSGLYVMTGLGARGFQAAFLLADHISAMISGQPLPVSSSVMADLLPCRFQIRDLRKTRPSHE